MQDFYAAHVDSNCFNIEEKQYTWNNRILQTIKQRKQCLLIQLSFTEAKCDT